MSLSGLLICARHMPAFPRLPVHKMLPLFLAMFPNMISTTQRATSTPHPNIAIQPSIKLLTPNRHLNSIKRILHNKVGIKLINSPDNRINIRLRRFREQQELRPRERLKACQSKVCALQNFKPGGAQGEIVRGDLRGRVLGVKRYGD